MIREYRLTYDQLNAMTLWQCMALMHQGKPPRPGHQRFTSVAERNKWREEQGDGGGE